MYLFKFFTIIILLIIYYFYLSFIDWFIHKYIMHNDNTLLQSWRQEHIIHHKEFNNEIKKQKLHRIYFSESIIIGILSGIVIIFYYYFFTLNINLI